MLNVLNERYPEFYQVKAKEWVKRLPETLLHGDYHPANHMFGLDENDGKQGKTKRRQHTPSGANMRQLAPTG